MVNSRSVSQALFDNPARYRIRALGQIKENWAARLEGMMISVVADEEGQIICTLEGELLDQAALVGVLNSLYELHLPVLMVNCLTWQERERPSTGGAATLPA